MADAPSRGELEAMHLLAGHLNIRLRRLELPQEFFALLDRSEVLGAQAAVARVAEWVAELERRAGAEQLAAEALRM